MLKTIRAIHIYNLRAQRIQQAQKSLVTTFKFKKTFVCLELESRYSIV